MLVMNSNLSLTWTSILFAVLWTAGMIWSTGAETANVVILAICGAIGGVCWYLFMRKFVRWQAGREA
jgi:hypothetical protein